MFALEHRVTAHFFVSAHHNSKLTNGTQLSDTDMEHSQFIVVEEPAEMKAQPSPTHHHQDSNVFKSCNTIVKKKSIRVNVVFSKNVEVPPVRLAVMVGA